MLRVDCDNRVFFVIDICHSPSPNLRPTAQKRSEIHFGSPLSVPIAILKGICYQGGPPSATYAVAEYECSRRLTLKS
jgi:hypothetical protein